MADRLSSLFLEKKSSILSVYFTAGFPSLNDTEKIIRALSNAGVDMIEIGMPFSDPLADGPVIQQSSTIALQNGMSIPFLFNQLHDIRTYTQVPLILMGYLNPVMQYGVEKFIKKASEIGIDATIIPDLPFDIYLKQYKDIYTKYNMKNVFLITPQTSIERIKLIDSHSDSFIYMVSTSSTTGNKEGTSDSQMIYFNKVKSLNLNNPCLIGFGIKDKVSFNKACQYAQGAIIGTAFINALTSSTNPVEASENFVKSILA